ncbi:MAG: ankyrin repeat domain-containing protein, partial [Syntrophobacteria bacterium]
MRKPQLGFLFMIVMLFALLACATSQEKARTKLDEMNITYDQNSFVQKAAEGDTQTVEYFLQARMDPNVTDEKGNTALIVAAKDGQLEIVEMLLDKGADIEGRDAKFGGTPLIWAAIRGQTETVKLLLGKGADINGVEEKNGMSATILAAIKGNNKIIGILLESGADVNGGDKDGRTPLMWAA